MARVLDNGCCWTATLPPPGRGSAAGRACSANAQGRRGRRRSLGTRVSGYHAGHLCLTHGEPHSFHNNREQTCSAIALYGGVGEYDEVGYVEP